MEFSGWKEDMQHTNAKAPSLKCRGESFPSALEDRRGLVWEVQKVALEPATEENVQVVLILRNAC